MEISKNSFATLLLCSDLSLNENIHAYTPVQWHSLAQRLWSAGLTPEALFNVDSIQKDIGLTDNETERINILIDRAGQMGISLSALNEKGIFTLTKSDSAYPERLKKKLKKYAPPVLYYSGNINILSNKGASVAGSRNIQEDAADFVHILTEKITAAGINLISGGARGTDSIAENTSNQTGGTSLILTADSLESKIRKKETRNAIIRDQTLVISAQRPDMPFRVYTAMARNKYIYALADYATAISSDAGKGGTWNGAIENLKNKWTPLFVRDGENIPDGNRKLLDMNEVFPITADDITGTDDIYAWFENNCTAAQSGSAPRQLSMFGL